MDFVSPLQRGNLVARYKRFLADIELDDGRTITAHCPNPGAMLGLNTPGLPVWVSVSPDPKRKLAHTLELVEIDGGLVGVNTMHPNRIVAEALASGAITELKDYGLCRREVKYGAASRIDFLLEGRAPSSLDDGPAEIQPAAPQRTWLEVKNCHLMRRPGLAEFPDCVAARSTKHLQELETMVTAGDRAVVLFVVQRTDCTAFSACHDLDPKFAQGLERAADFGVEVMVFTCQMDVTGVTLAARIPWVR
ncbi:DNA/RNA nuclease SfsA [Phenylobacterium sp.]|uniref:DNA/RNA nuclease SfsA n=1 Tax=Phenylobacterium sp. TaxID=1871053 RepID=UPI00272F9446|nr:DNA/RNA nuclease SfsA [Phenylobacterium sp.]MDP1875185.1 DNA/RNA nuclease SfsA [Phenylobacterium sp.]